MFKVGDLVKASRELSFPDGTKVPAGTKGTVAGAATTPGVLFVLFVGFGGLQPVAQSDLQAAAATDISLFIAPAILSFSTGDRVKARRSLNFPSGNSVSAGQRGTVTGSAPTPRVVLVLFDNLGGNEEVAESDLERA